MQTKHIWKKVPATSALLIVGALGLAGVACGTVDMDAQDQASESASGVDATIRETMKMFDIPGLTFAGACTWSAGIATVTLHTSDTVIIGRDSTTGGNITINGNNTYCQNANYLNTSGFSIVIAAAATNTSETVVLDFSNGYFALASATANSGFSINLGGKTASPGDKDQIQVRMQNVNNVGVNQNVTIGNLGVHLAGNNFLDVAFAASPNAFTIAMGGGNDRINAAGDTAAGVVPAWPVTIYGNAGNDNIYTSGANYNDVYSGGNGNDYIFVAATPIPTASAHYAISGGNGFDTVDFSSRTGNMNLTISGNYTSGSIASPVELHMIATDVESLVGGSGADVMSGGPANQNTVLYGGPGNDNFVQIGTAAADSNDTIWGGPGVDSVFYISRSCNANISLDGNTNDGCLSLGEKDNIQTDVENVYAGSGINYVAGNGNNNILDGGTGTGNSIFGLGGDDTFLQTAAGKDYVYGGAGTDTVSYERRSGTITAALDGTASSGESGENDTLNTDIENLTGGTSSNTLTGNTSDNTISGNTASTSIHDCKGGSDISIHGSTVSNCEIVFP